MARPTLNALCRGGKEPAEQADTPMSLLATLIATQVVLTFLTSVPVECHPHTHCARARARTRRVLLLELALVPAPVRHASMMACAWQCYLGCSAYPCAPCFNDETRGGSLAARPARLRRWRALHASNQSIKLNGRVHQIVRMVYLPTLLSYPPTSISLAPPLPPNCAHGACSCCRCPTAGCRPPSAPAWIPAGPYSEGGSGRQDAKR